jgi:ribosomal protein L37AE/L43A
MTNIYDKLTEREPKLIYEALAELEKMLSPTIECKYCNKIQTAKGIAFKKVYNCTGCSAELLKGDYIILSDDSK